MSRPVSPRWTPGAALVLRTLAALSLAARPATAQSDLLLDGPRFAPGVAVETFRFDAADQVGIESVTLVSTPFAASARMGRLRLGVQGAWAEASLESAAGTRSTLSGLTDTEVRVDVSVIRDQLTLTLRGLAPSGATGFSAEEFVVAGVVASDLLPFRVSSWGNGGGVALGATYTRRFGGLGVGAGVDWRRSGTFTPLSAVQAEYQPGDRVAIQLALDGNLTGAARASLRLGYRDFGDDLIDGGGLFQAGSRLEAIANLGFPTRFGGSAAIYGGLLHRRNGRFLLGDGGQAPSQDLVLAGAIWRLGVGRGWVQPRTDLRLFRSEDGVGQGLQLGVGASAEIPVNAGVTLVPVLMGRFGDVEVSRGNASDFVGAEAGLSIRFGR
jgi:hypothetical protein